MFYSLIFALKVLVPLVLLRQMLLALMRRGAGPWSTLLQFGVTFLEEHAAEFIIQQGGWVRARAAVEGVRFLWRLNTMVVFSTSCVMLSGEAVLSNTQF